MVFWTFLGNPEAWSQDFLHIKMAVAILLEEVSASSTADWRVDLAINFLSSIRACL